ncbi:MAG: DciA family protein [Alphaproteobacteria bacterium]|nr:DciA family protein [Alphaproteobacteria bacterium]
MNLRKTNSPKRISIISRNITKDIFKKRGFKEHKVITNWKDIVGDEISIYTIPESLTHNKLLTIKCESSHALEFQYHIPKIIERITIMMGYPAVKSIRIKQGNIKNKNKAVKIKKNAISKKNKEELHSILNKVNDENLKKKLINFSKSFFSNIDK